jgi:hypothetical protein
MPHSLRWLCGGSAVVAAVCGGSQNLLKSLVRRFLRRLLRRFAAVPENPMFSMCGGSAAVGWGKPPTTPIALRTLPGWCAGLTSGEETAPAPTPRGTWQRRLRSAGEALAAPDLLGTLHTDLEAALGPLATFDVRPPEMPGACAP